MTGSSTWANRYLEHKRSARADDLAETERLGFAPEASEYMDGLSAFELTHLPEERRTEYLETAARTLVDAMDREDGVADRSCAGGVRRVVAYTDDDPVVAVLDGFGEVISLDPGTAALVAFALSLEPERATDAEDDLRTAEE